MRRKSDLQIIISFLAAPVIIYTIIVVYAIISAFCISFTKWTGGVFEKVGFKNFIEIFHDRNAGIATTNTLVWTVVTTILTLVICFGLAVLLNTEWLKFKNAFKLIFIIPQGIGFAAAGIIWSVVYAPEMGILNIILRNIGLRGAALPWLGDPRVALYALIFAQFWMRMGFYMIMFINRLQTLPPNLVESARIDGANTWQVLWKITIPLSRTVFMLVISLTIIDALKTFDVIFATTKGGPGLSTEVLGSLIYNEAFDQFNLGYASALSVVLLIFTMIITGIYLSIAIKGEEEI